MIQRRHSFNSGVSPVRRTKQEARQFYDRISRLYGCFAGVFERKYAEMALHLLAIRSGEVVLEIGFGTGYCLQKIARLVGGEGRAYGIDISHGMVEVTRKRLEKAGLIERVELRCGDAVKLPYGANAFDAAFMSFTLELFDTPEIPEILSGVRRVLKPKGRLGVVSLSKSYGESAPLRLYEWAHDKWPKYADGRPICVEKSLMGAGYKITAGRKAQMMLLPVEIVVATKANQ